MKKLNTIKKALSMMLALCMVLQYVPATAFAVTTDNLCEHHAEHSQEVCGYVEGVSQCAYHCDECLGHDHEEPSEEPTEEPEEEVYPGCAHHNHDDACGGITNACSYVCETCVAEIQAMVDALPDMEDITNESKPSVAQALRAIDARKYLLSDAGVAAIDFGRYADAAFAMNTPENFFGFCVEKRYEASAASMPQASFAFLDDKGEAATVITAEGVAVTSISPIPNEGAVRGYLPVGTYTLEESVAGQWDLTLSVNGQTDSDHTFTGASGQVYMIAAINQLRRELEVNSSENGSVYVTDYDLEYGESLYMVVCGTTVTLEPVPNEGYDLDTLTVLCEEEELEITFHEEYGTYTFTMPTGNVTVTATFKLHEHEFNPADGKCICGAVCEHTPDEDSYINYGDDTHSYTCATCGGTGTEGHNFVDGACVCGARDKVIMTGGEVLYLKPGSDWESQSARFAVFLYSNSGEQVWVDLEPVPGNAGYYCFTVPEGSWINLIFLRMAPADEENVWDNKWNQTSDLSYDGVNNLFTITDGGDASYDVGDWSQWTPVCNHVYAYDDKGDGTHDKVCSECGAVAASEAHTGGTATCQELAKCDFCGASYGELGGHSFDSATGKCACNAQAAVSITLGGSVTWYKDADSAFAVAENILENAIITIHADTKTQNYAFLSNYTNLSLVVEDDVVLTLTQYLYFSGSIGGEGTIAGEGGFGQLSLFGNSTQDGLTVTAPVDIWTTIEGGTFTGEVENHGTISGGQFSGPVTNFGGTICDGTFTGGVLNQYNTDLRKDTYITGGVFRGAVTNEGGRISGGAFYGELTNKNVSVMDHGMPGMPGMPPAGMVTYYGTITNTETPTTFTLGEDFSVVNEDGTINCTSHIWKDNVCRLCAYVCSHSGGKPTCMDPAVCDICGREYGEIAPGAHVFDSKGTCACGAKYLYFHMGTYTDIAYSVFAYWSESSYTSGQTVEDDSRMRQFVYHPDKGEAVHFVIDIGYGYTQPKTVVASIPTDDKNAFRITGYDNDTELYTGIWYVHPCDHSFKDGSCTICTAPCPHDAWDETYHCTVCGHACVHENYNYDTHLCQTCGKPCEHSSFVKGECQNCGLVCSEHELDNNGFCDACDMRQIYIVTKDWSECQIYYNHGTAESLGNGLFVTMIPENAAGFYFIAYDDEYYDRTKNLELPAPELNAYYVGQWISSDGWSGDTYDGKWAIYPCDHDWLESVCSKCGSICGHTWENSVCTACGKICTTHWYMEGKCYFCGKECMHESYRDGKCAGCRKNCPGHTLDDDGFCSVCDLRQIYVKAKNWSVCTLVYDSNRIAMEATEAGVYTVMLSENASEFYFVSVIPGAAYQDRTYELNLPGPGENCYYVGESDKTEFDNEYYTGQWGMHPCVHNWQESVCTICGEVCNHTSDGVQTCMGYKCSVCGSWYGVGNGDNHIKIGACDCGLTAYPIWVCGIQVTNVNQNNVIPGISGGAGHPAISYIPEENVLRLSGKFGDPDAENDALKVIGDITVSVEGLCEVYGNVNVSGMLTLQGQAKMRVMGQSYGIRAENVSLGDGGHLVITATKAVDVATVTGSGYSRNADNGAFAAFENPDNTGYFEFVGEKSTTDTISDDHSSHILSCTCGCNTAVKEGGHTTDATCSTKAVCSICGEYGEVDPDAHSFDETGKCICNAQAAASTTVGGETQYYPTLDAAIAAIAGCAAEDNAVVKLENDIDLGEASVFVYSGVFTLDLNDRELRGSGEQVLSIAGSDVVMTIVDTGIEENKGAITGATGIYVRYGTATISGGNVSGTAYGIDLLRAVVYITGGHVSGGDRAVYDSGYGTLRVTGGSISGGNYDIYARYPDISSVNLEVAEGKTEGATFPGGITVGGENSPLVLADCLGEGVAYWKDGKMILPTDDRTEITGGDVVIKAACEHENGTKQNYIPDGDTHSFTWSCCGYEVSESHSSEVEFRDNGDGKTHNGHCADCGGLLGHYLEWPHNYDSETHACICGYVERFTLSFYADENAQEPVATFQVPYNTQLYTVEHNEETGEFVITGATDYLKDLFSQIDMSELVKEHYTFAEWNLETSDSKMYDDQSFLATWKPVSYKMTWDMAGCAYELYYPRELPDELPYCVDAVPPYHEVQFQSITPPAGYEIVRYEDGDGNELEVGYKVNDRGNVTMVKFVVAGDTTFKVITRPKTYMATWSNGEGGEYEKEFTFGETITIPDNEFFLDTFRKAGYTLTGWEGYTEGMTMPVDGITFTAIYEANKYTITFDTDGGTAVAPIIQPYGTAVIVPAAPTKDGFHFVGWDGEIPATMPIGGLTRKAVWEEHKELTYASSGNTITAFCGKCNEPVGTAKITAQSKTYDGMPIVGVVVEATGVLENEEIGVIYKQNGEEINETPTKAGDYTASITAGTASATAEFTIAQREVGIKWIAPENLVFSGEQKIACAEAAGLMEGDVCTLDVKLEGDNVNVGNFRYSVTGLSNPNYKLPADVNSPAYTITAKKVTILDAEIEAVTYNSEGYTLKVNSITFNGLITGDDLDYTASAELTGTNAAGEQEATVTVKIVSGNYALENDICKAKVLIAKAPVTILGTDMTVAYDGQDIDLRRLFSIDENADDMDYSIIDLTGDGSFTDAPYLYHILKVGTFTVKVTSEETENYLSGSATAVLTVTKAEPVITAPTEKTGLIYTGEAQSLVTAGTVDGGKLVYSLSENGAYSETIPTGENAGSYTVWYYVQGDENHNDSAKASVTVEIDKADIADHARIFYAVSSYDGIAKEVSIVRNEDAENSNLVAGVDYELVYESADGSDALVDGLPVYAGDYKVTLTGIGNFTGTVTEIYIGRVEGIFPMYEDVMTIQKAYIFFDEEGLTAKDKVYDGNTDAELNDITFDGIITGDDVYVNMEAAFCDANAGIHKDVIVTATLLGEDADNYQIYGPYEPLKADIMPKQITVTAINASKTYGEADPALTFEIVGLVSGDKLTGELKRAEGEDVGSYAIGQGTLTAGTNYTVIFTGADFAVTKAPAEGVEKTASGNLLICGESVVAIPAALPGSAYGQPQFSAPVSKAVLENGKLTVAGSGAAAGETYTVTIPVTSRNYADYTVIVTLTAVGHKYGEAIYTGDGKTAYKASRTCIYGCGDIQTAEATITAKVTKEATCTDAGERTYTAQFTADWAEGKITTETIGQLQHNWTDATCREPKTCRICGAKEGAKLNHIYTDDQDTDCNRCGEKREVKPEQTIKTTPMYRLYNPNTGEHFFTGSAVERDDLVEVGWNYEGIAWNAPVEIGDPVYRLFNPNSGDHHYTMSAEERDALVEAGWNYEGVAWNSAAPNDLPQYRMYNPNADIGSHHYTGSTKERDDLVAAGWKYEGIGWYGLLY